MPRRAPPRPADRLSTRVDFHRTKYGREILIDVAWVHDMPTFLRPEPHALSFYDILLVTRGRGSFSLDGNRYRVAPGQLFFTTPGQVRSWAVQGLDGVCLFFPAAFLVEFFNDAEFLHRLPYFHVASSACAIKLPAARAATLKRALLRMRRELGAWRADSAHLLRARLYEQLVNLARVYARAHRAPASRIPNRTVVTYRQLVEDRAPRQRHVAPYARELAVSASHLNRLCRRHLGISAKSIILERIEVEARRLLVHSERPAGQIARDLGFRDPSYFTRFFRRRTGTTPARFRAESLGAGGIGR